MEGDSFLELKPSQVAALYRKSERCGTVRLKNFGKHYTEKVFHVGADAHARAINVPFEWVGKTFRTDLEGLVGFFLSPDDPLDASSAIPTETWHQVVCRVGGKRGSLPGPVHHRVFWEFFTNGKNTYLFDEQGEVLKVVNTRLNRVTVTRRYKEIEFLAYAPTEGEARALLSAELERHVVHTAPVRS